MKYFLSALMMTFCLQSNAAFFPLTPSLTIANHAFTDLSSNLVMLIGYINTGSEWATLRQPNGSGGYQVPSGKTLTIYSIAATQLIASGGSVERIIQCAQSTSDVGFSSGSAPTGLTYIGGSSTLQIGTAGGGSFAGTRIESPTNFPVAATDYFSCVSNSGVGTDQITVEAYGYVQ